MIKISVIMPVYNVEDYLEECLDSVIGQTLKEIEIICINDGSTDQSTQILDRFATIDSRIRIISKKNTGYGHSVNIGLDEAKGQYISIVETDDRVDPVMLEELYKIAFENDLDVLKTDHRIFVSDNGKYDYTYCSALPDGTKDLYCKVINPRQDIRVFQGYVYTWAGIYKRDFLNIHHIRHNESPGASYQDNGFWFQTIMYADRIYFLDRAYYNLRRDNPGSSVYSKEKVFCICDEYDFIRNKILSSDILMKKELLYQAFYYRFVHYLFTMRRIDDQYRQAFYDRMREDFIFALQNVEIDPHKFTREQWGYIHTVICEPDRVFIEFDRLSTQAKDRLRRASSILIYGAGKWGMYIFDLLDKSGMRNKIKGFVISNQNTDQHFINGVKIYPVNELSSDESSLIIIAVRDQYIDEIEKELIDRNYTDRLTRRELFG